MGRQRHDQVADSFIDIDEAAVILELDLEQVQKLVEKRKLTAFQLAEGMLRLKKDEVWELKTKIRIDADLFPEDREIHQHQPVVVKGSIFDPIRDFFYFNDFYILSLVVVSLLFYLILSSN
ncbi:MAG: hypothetical protein KC649_01800 [Candidatus Omnitrophica bacterium]|nr:hypothetical protein [Candidatus Omnitrophota bacterium]